ncbi:unnamed protein product [Protopolystoma xenopodis]|uniref:Uncharacterized protein n=1 Tax=Protopolystoma xenopodis TaxID=117903 RepID=A0A3S5BJQ4_9PLAT|nr:unnamed protein product [Protopolystoma xenopodis]
MILDLAQESLMQEINTLKEAYATTSSISKPGQLDDFALEDSNSIWSPGLEASEPGTLYHSPPVDARLEEGNQELRPSHAINSENTVPPSTVDGPAGKSSDSQLSRASVLYRRRVFDQLCSHRSQLAQFYFRKGYKKAI